MYHIFPDMKCSPNPPTPFRDGGKRYMGKGVLKAVENVNGPIKAALLGKVRYYIRFNFEKPPPKAHPLPFSGLR